MFREPEEKKLFETDRLAADPTDADDVNMDVSKGSGAKDNSGPLSSANPLASAAAPNPLPSNMDSRYVLPTKTPSFA